MVRRETYLLKMRQLKDVQLIKVVTGVRRCGKSTLLEQLADELLASGVAAQNIKGHIYNSLSKE
jgi:predicted AAA+ superfamily ATPase